MHRAHPGGGGSGDRTNPIFFFFNWNICQKSSQKSPATSLRANLLFTVMMTSLHLYIKHSGILPATHAICSQRENASISHFVPYEHASLIQMYFFTYQPHDLTTDPTTDPSADHTTDPTTHLHTDPPHDRSEDRPHDQPRKQTKDISP